ncbi:Nuclear transcription factor Y subunit A-10 [Acorus calamus]|uniref:Nuclear transcription factor Y subunit A-10 n=1 Tax=Acorus calamus TaxID=4465 RepID=A0AAV9CG66_ACOCL|nr:Nuclear transcription factor Y subunit A-10 [Acorus calamus]
MQTTMCFKDYGGIVLNSIAEATSGPLAPHWGVFGSQTIYDCGLGQYKSSSLDKSGGKSTLQDVPLQMHHDTEQGPVSTILEKDGQVTTKFSPFSDHRDSSRGQKTLQHATNIVMLSSIDEFQGHSNPVLGHSMRGRMLLPLNMTEHRSIYVNAKQYHGIIVVGSLEQGHRCKMN